MSTLQNRHPISESEFPSLLARFTKQDSNGCWNWTGSKSAKGYGQWPRGGRAHRKIFEFVRGAIPDGLQLDHLCGNRGCVNPKHLEPVTPAQNQRRSSFTLTSIHLAKSFCPQGHPYDSDNTYQRPGGRGRKCKQCNRERWH